MGFLMKLNRNRFIRAIARNLPPILTDYYGASDYYTCGQVTKAMEDAGCNMKLVDSAYAMFCSREEFEKISNGDYESLHQEVSEICFHGNTDFDVNDIMDYSDGIGSGTVSDTD